MCGNGTKVIHRCAESAHHGERLLSFAAHRTRSSAVQHLDNASSDSKKIVQQTAFITPIGTPIVARPLLLIVDDEAPVLRIIERLAAKVGFDVVSCGSGSEAMRELARRPADLAMIDLRM